MFSSKEVSVVSLGYALVDFNPKEKEKTFTEDKIRFISFRKGDIFLVTIRPNRFGWFEAYRAGDPTNTLGICHQNFASFYEF